MDFIEQVHFFGLSNIHTFGPNIRLIRLFSLMLNYANPDYCIVDKSKVVHNKETEEDIFILTFRVPFD